MKKRVLYKLFGKVLFLFFVNFSPYQLLSQDKLTVSEYYSFSDIIGYIEQKYGIKVYYKDINLSNLKFHSSTKELNLDDAIERIEEISNSYSLFIDKYVVLLPKSEQIDFSKYEGTRILQIGSQSDLGKSSKVTIKGRVLDGKTREPLIGAIIYNEKFEQGSSTNINGEYNFQITVGDHKLKISYVGYEDSYQVVRVYSSGEADFEIFEKTVSLDGVYVYSERPEQNITRTQMSVDRINSKGIKELPVSVGEVDVIKSFTLLPGVQSAGEFGTGLNVRGGGTDQNLILVEDVPLFNSSHLFGLTSIINSDAVNNVTLIKAGIPAKYGERVSSVMSIKMNPVSSNVLKMKAGIGVINSKLLLELPLYNNKIGLAFGGRTSYSDWLLKKMPDVDLMNSKTKFYDLNGLLTLNLSAKNRISVFGYRSIDYFNYSTRTSYSYSNSLGSAKWYRTINNNLSFNLIVGLSNYNYQVSERDTLKLFEAYKIKSSLDYRMLKYNLLFTPNKTHSFEFGINANYYIIKPGKIEPYQDGSSIITFSLNSERAIESGIFVSDNININSKFGVDVGLRYSSFLLLGPGRQYIYEENTPRLNENIIDTLSFSKCKIIKTYGGVEPRVNFRFTIDDSKSLKMSYSRVNQYVNLVSVTSSIAPSDMWKLSNKYLKPLRSDQFSFGYFNNFRNNSIETSIELYYKQLENVLEYKNGVQVVMNPNVESGLVNAQGYNMGVEVYIKRNSEKFGGWISYTLSQSMRRSNGKWEDERINNNAYFPSSYDKTHNLVINTNYYISKRWRFAATFTYNTGRPITLPEYEYYLNGYKYIYYSDRNAYRLPDYHRLDLSISLGESIRVKKKWSGSFTFSLINVYGRRNAYTVFYQKDNTISDASYNLYKLYIIGRPFPTLTYNLTF